MLTPVTFRSEQELRERIIVAQRERHFLILSDAASLLLGSVENATRLLSSLIDQDEILIHSVASILIVTEDEMKRVVFAVQDVFDMPRSMTDDEHSVAVAKCIPVMSGEGEPTLSHIVFQANTLADLNEAHVITDTNGTYNIELINSSRRSLHTVMHEFGHCRDYAERKVHRHSRYCETIFHFECEATDYYGNIILEEYLADTFAAFVVDEDLYKQRRKGAIERVEFIQSHNSNWVNAHESEVHSAMRQGFVNPIDEALWLCLFADATMAADIYGNPDSCFEIDPFYGIQSPEEAKQIRSALWIVLAVVKSKYPYFSGEAAVHVLGMIWQSLLRRRK